MKKLITILTFSFLILIITGCKNDKVLTCVSDSKDIYGYFTIEDMYVLQFDYSGKHLIGYKEEEKFIFGPNLTQEDKDDSSSQLLEQCEEYNKLNGISCEFNKNDEYFHTYVKITTSELDVESRKKFFANDNYDEWKERLSEEYTCE